MSSFNYTRTRTRDRASPPPLPRRPSFKRPRLFDAEDDDGYDDYPYSGAHQPSRALAKRDQPGQLERWNIWSDTRKQVRCDSAAPDDDRERGRRRVSFADDAVDDEEDEERVFRLRVAALSRDRPRRVALPRMCETESDDEVGRARVWSGEMLRSRDRCVSEEYEARERARSRSRERRRRERWCADGDEREVETEADRWVRWRRVKRTRTEEWRPLAGWRRV